MGQTRKPHKCFELQAGQQSNRFIHPISLSFRLCCAFFQLAFTFYPRHNFPLEEGSIFLENHGQSLFKCYTTSYISVFEVGCEGLFGQGTRKCEKIVDSKVQRRTRRTFVCVYLDPGSIWSLKNPAGVWLRRRWSAVGEVCFIYVSSASIELCVLYFYSNPHEIHHITD